MKLLKYWNETWGSLAIIIIPLFYSIDYTKEFISNFSYAWIVSLLVFIVAWIQTNKNFNSKQFLKDKIESLSNENTIHKSNFDAIPENMVKNLSKYFNLGNTERITVYRVKDNEWFIPVGRFSENPILRKSGREKYPIDSGFIGICWAEEEVKVQNLPNFNRGHDKYIDEVRKKCDIDSQTVAQLNMKSRSFYCKRLTFNGDEPLAVVVIESLNGTFPANFDELKIFLDGPFGIALIDAIKNNLPIGREE